MKQLLLVFCVLASGYASTAQTIAGGDMESWRSSTAGPSTPVNVQAPNGWYGVDSIIIGLGQSFGTFLGTTDSDWHRNLFREDSIKHSGAHSAKLMTVIQDTLLLPGVLSTAQTHVGITLLPTPGITGISFSGGNHVTVKPLTVSAWVQYYPGKDSTGMTGIDSGTLTVQALSFIGTKDSVIGTGTIVIAPCSSWTQITDTIRYLSDTTHPIDTMRITFTSSSRNGLDSSTLYVDDVTMTSEANPVVIDHTGINNISTADHATVFPNPASGTLNIRTNENEVLNVTLITVSGQQVAHATINGNGSIDVKNLPAGLYFYEITDVSGSMLQRGKIAVNN